jgi:hypothetical protein
MKRALLLVALIACKSEPTQAAHANEGATANAAAASTAPAHHEDRAQPATAAPALSLAVTIDGAAATWNADAFAKVAHAPGTNNNGESRDVWSLRELAHTLVGPNARVVSVTGENGTKPIDPAAWADASRTPIVHTTRRGTLKFRWADAAGTWAEAEIKDVSKLEIAR